MSVADELSFTKTHSADRGSALLNRVFPLDGKFPREQRTFRGTKELNLCFQNLLSLCLWKTIPGLIVVLSGVDCHKSNTVTSGATVNLLLGHLLLLLLGCWTQRVEIEMQNSSLKQWNESMAQYRFIYLYILCVYYLYVCFLWTYVMWMALWQ